MSPAITTVGIKASLVQWSVTTDVPATSNLSLTTNLIMTMYSIENVSVELEGLEWDGTTWSAINDLDAAPIGDVSADNQVGHYAVPTSNHVRWRNPTGGALWVKALGWFMN